MKVSVVLLAGLAAIVSAAPQDWSPSNDTDAAAAASTDPNASPTTTTSSPSGYVAAAAVTPTTTPGANGTTWGTWNSTGSPANVAAAATSTSCPPWTLGTSAPAYLTNLPSSIQAALPTWSGTPPSDWCSNTAWMAAYASCTSNSTSAVAAATNTAAPSSGTVTPAK